MIKLFNKMESELIVEPDTLIITATLGDRNSIVRTVESVKFFGKSRVKHVLITPSTSCQKVKALIPELEVLVEPSYCKGIYSALNFSFNKLANDYKYIGFINDDDYWLPNFFKLFDILDRFDDVDVAYGKIHFVNELDEVIGQQSSSYRYKSFKYLLFGNIVLFTQQSTLMRSHVFNKVNGFDESYKLAADTKFWLNAIEMKLKFRFVDAYCAAYTIQANQLSSNKEQQLVEHKLLTHNIKYNFLRIYLEIFLHRIFNLKIYFNRFFNNKNIKPGLYK